MRLRETAYPARFLGRPPFAPFAREAAAFATLVVRPACRAHCFAIHAFVPNTPATVAGTYRVRVDPGPVQG